MPEPNPYESPQGNLPLPEKRQRLPRPQAIGCAFLLATALLVLAFLCYFWRVWNAVAHWLFGQCLS